MTFTSVSFIIFLLVVIITEPIKKYGHYLFIVIISLIFYSFAGFFLVFLLLLSSFSDHQLSLRFTKKNKLIYLVFAVTLNLCFLIGVKVFYYTDFEFNTLKNLIPLGISFYTLQSISYLIDIYNGKTKRLSNFIEYLAYISFFPQLIAGPIERCSNLHPQLKSFGLVRANKMPKAIRLFVIGIYLKLVVSNGIAGPINAVSESLKYDILFFLNGIFAAIYIYVDFFSYTLMARGIAALFGINLGINFNQPFRKKTLIGFWRNWHISLTKWTIDYIYLPIISNLNGTKKQKIFFSIFVMVLIGLWHGIGLNFVLFGIIHGTMMQLLPLCDKYLSNFSFKFPKINNRFGLFFIVMITANIFLCGHNQQLMGFLDLSNYLILNVDNMYVYMNTSFLIGVLGAIPLGIHEFQRKSFFYIDLPLKLELIFISLCLIMTALFYSSGGDHVYFAF
ncbi:hypothetical protein N8366_09240 [Amylibacter sp.]|nr:hypothetical protein [Amylibacter sp.]